VATARELFGEFVRAKVIEAEAQVGAIAVGRTHKSW